MSLTDQKEFNEDIAVLKEPELRKRIFDLAQEGWDDQMGDMTITHVHTVLDALHALVFEMAVEEVERDGE